MRAEKLCLPPSHWIPARVSCLLEMTGWAWAPRGQRGPADGPCRGPRNSSPWPSPVLGELLAGIPPRAGRQLNSDIPAYSEREAEVEERARPESHSVWPAGLSPLLQGLPCEGAGIPSLRPDTQWTPARERGGQAGQGGGLPRDRVTGCHAVLPYATPLCPQPPPPCTPAFK